MDNEKSVLPQEPLVEEGNVPQLALPRAIHLIPMDTIDGFDVRPGFYEINGATAIPGGVNFTSIPTGRRPWSFCSSSVRPRSPTPCSPFRRATVSAMCTP